MKGELCGQRGNARAMRAVEIDEGSCVKNGLSRLMKDSARKVSFCEWSGLRARYDLPIDCCAFATLSTIE